MSRYFHPVTKEHIDTTNPAKWMGEADTSSPAYNPQTQGCFYRDGEWVVEDVDTTKHEREQRRQEILARLTAIDSESLRPLRAVQQGTATDFDTEKLTALESEAAALRTELAGL